RQIMVNLLANAVQYSPDGGEIVVRARVDDGRVQLEVEDHGVGIEPSEQAKVFDKFYRSPDAIISPIRGTGLGLAIVKNLVEAHGGSVGVRSTAGQGSVFFFSLPITPSSHAPAQRSN